MKKNSINLTNLFQLLLIVILIILGTTKLNAQLKVGSNPQQLAPNALLEIESNIGKVAVFTKDSAFLGLGTLSPTRRLEIQNGNSPGAIKIVDGTQGAGKILTSDANGVGTWSNPFIATPQNITNSNGIIVYGGIGAALVATALRLDSMVVAKMLGQSPVKDSLSSVVSNIITSGSVTGQNTTAGNLIIVTNGTGASLKSMTVSTDTSALKTFIAKNVGTSPIKDSLAKTLGQSPVKDSLSSVVSSIITTGSVTGQNTTAGNLIIVTNGTGASLKSMTVSTDTTALKTFIAKNVGTSPIKDSLAKTLGQSPVKDSLSSVVSSIITTGSVTGQNTTAGNLIIVTNGTGASLKSMTVSTDTTALKTFIAKNVGASPIKDSLAKTLGQSPVKDSLSSVVSSIITTGSVTGQNTTAGNLIIVTNGTGASLKSMTVSTDTTALKTFIAKNVGASPIKDSIKSIVTNQLQNSYIVTNIAGVIPALSLGDAGSISLTVLGAAIGNNVVVNPTTDLPFGIVIAYSRVIAPNTIKIGFVGTGSVAAHATSFDIRVFN